MGSVVLLSLIGGYPMGAKSIAGLLEQGRLDRATAQRMLPFCCCAGPSFIITAVGSGMFGSAQAGILLYLVQLFVSILLGAVLGMRERGQQRRMLCANRGVNQGAVNFLRSLNHGLNKRWPTGIYMAEDSTNFLKVTAPTRYDGVGFDYKWDMGWMHDTLDYFATPFGERPNAYGKLLFSMHYFYNELYLLALSHDEVVHGKKTIIDKLWGTYAEKCAQLRTLYFYMYMHPGKKLNFMGNELGHFREWDEKRELDWDLLKYPFHDAFQKYFARLSLVYATEPALFDGEYNPDCFEWVASESCTEGVYAWLRKGRGQNLLCIMNTQDHAHKKFPLYLKFPCSAELVLDTEAAEWGGAHKGRRKLHFHTTDGGVYGRDYTLTVDLPAMGSFLLRLTPEAPNPDAARISANKAMAQKRRTARAKNSSK